MKKPFRTRLDVSQTKKRCENLRCIGPRMASSNSRSKRSGEIFSLKNTVLGDKHRGAWTVASFSPQLSIRYFRLFIGYYHHQVPHVLSFCRYVRDLPRCREQKSIWCKDNGSGGRRRMGHGTRGGGPILFSLNSQSSLTKTCPLSTQLPTTWDSFLLLHRNNLAVEQTTDGYYKRRKVWWWWSYKLPKQNKASTTNDHNRIGIIHWPVLVIDKPLT